MSIKLEYLLYNTVFFKWIQEHVCIHECIHIPCRKPTDKEKTWMTFKKQSFYGGAKKRFNSKMDKEDIIAKLSAYDFSEPVKVTVSFEDSDEESQWNFIKKEIKNESDAGEATKDENEVTNLNKSIDNSELKLQIPENPIGINNQVNNSNKNVTEDEQELFSLIEKCHTEISAGNHISNSNNSKKRKIDDTPQIQTQQKQTIQNCHIPDMTHINDNNVHQNGPSTCATYLVDKSSYNRDNTSSTQETGEKSKTDRYVMDLLKTVSLHLIYIVEAYHCYLQTVKNKNTEEMVNLSRNRFMYIKNHFFNLSYCTVLTIILPHEKYSNFIQDFLNETVKISHHKLTQWQLGYFLKEMMEWTKVKEKSLNKLPILYGTSDEQYANKSKLAPNWTQPMQPFHSGVKDNNPNSRPHSSYTCSTYESNNPLLNQYLTQHSHTLYSKEHNKTNISSLSANTSNTPFSSAPPLNNNVYQEPNESCTFTSGPPGRQKSINVNAQLLNQGNGQAFSNVSVEKTTHNQPRDCIINPYQYAQTENWQPANYLHQRQNDQGRAPSSQPVGMNYQNNVYKQNGFLPGFHGPPTSQQQAQLSSMSTAQPLPPSLATYSQPPASATHPLTIVASSAAQSLPLPSTVQPLISSSAAQPWLLASAMQPLLPSSAAQSLPLVSQPPAPPSYQMALASNKLNREPLATTQHIRQPLQIGSVDQHNQQETNRSVSTDSGFMSPLHFNSPVEQTIDTWVQEQQNLHPTPLITHVTSLNPKAAFMNDGTCSICSKTTNQKCIGCMNKYYCSYECQEADWSLHKFVCKKQ